MSIKNNISDRLSNLLRQFLFLSIGLSFAQSTPIYADSPSDVGDPYGSNVNGYYTSGFKVDYQAFCAGASDPYPGSFESSSLGGGAEGTHDYVFVGDEKGNLYYSIDDSDLRNVFACAVGAGSQLTVLNDFQAKVDTGLPTYVISSPQPGAQISGGSVVVAGSVLDAISGIDRVTVENIPASLNGNSFSRTVTLPSGVTGFYGVVFRVFDKAGHSRAETITINVGGTGTGGSKQSNPPPINRSSVSPSNQNPATTAASPNPVPAVQPVKPEQVRAKDSPPPTPSKGFIGVLVQGLQAPLNWPIAGLAAGFIAIVGAGWLLHDKKRLLAMKQIFNHSRKK
jgi:hypothetical protein